MSRGRFLSSLTLVGAATFVFALLAAANGPALVAVALIGLLYALALVVRYKRLGGPRAEAFATLVRGIAGFLVGLGAGSAAGVDPPAAGLVFAGLALHAGRRRLQYEKGGLGFGIVVAGVALVGVGGWLTFQSVGNRLPAADQLLVGAGLLYVFWVLRVLLAYAAGESDKRVNGVAGWLRQNLARNALFAGVLVAYFVARPWISENVPMFSMVEFAFGMILFGAILARLRNMVKRDLAESPTASERRRHVARVDARSESSYDRLARVVEDFVERGEGAETYREVVAQVVGVEPDHADFSPVARFRETRPGPAVPFPQLTLAALAQASGAAIAAILLLESSPLSFALAAALAGFALYRFQDEAKAAASVEAVLGFGLSGSGLVAVGLYSGSVAMAGGSPPPLFLGLVAFIVLAIVAVPVAEALRMRKRLANNTWPLSAPRLEALAKREKTSRERATAVGVAALVLFVPLASAVSWLAAVGVVPSGFVASLEHLQGPLGAFLGGLFISYAILWSAARAARPRVESEETARRSRRLDAHRAVMDRLVTR